jgi:hypothetical protein
LEKLEELKSENQEFKEQLKQIMENRNKLDDEIH